EAAGAEPRRVVVCVGRRYDLRGRPAQRREIPQRRGRDGRGREVFLRALSRNLAPDAEGPGGGGGDPGSPPRALQAQAALARLPYLLRGGHRRRLDRAEEIRGKRRRGGLQA